MKSETPKLLELIAGDARHIPLPDESVQCVVTSPPYWGLRKYAGEQELIWDPAPDICTGLGLAELGKRYRGGGKKQGRVCEHEFIGEGASRPKPDRSSVGKDANGSAVFGGARGVQGAKASRGEVVQYGGTCVKCGAWRGGYGLEPTIEMYVAHSLEILRELRRVLRKDGVVFWNIGDSYAGGGNGAANYPGDYPKQNSVRGSLTLKGVGGRKSVGLKPKDLCLIPERIALAAQADGWWVRSRILWAKANPMPESVRDRPTDAAEHIWMLTKSERYFWDAEAVREKSITNDIRRPYGSEGAWELDGRPTDQRHGGEPRNAFGYTPKGTHSRGNGDGGPKAQQREAEGTFEKWADSTRDVVMSRNLRSVWMFATQPYRGAHFATFPEEIPRRAILAATSAKGACAQCGKPWERITRCEVHFEGGSGRAMERNSQITVPAGWHQSGSGRWKPEHVDRFKGGNTSWRGERTIPDEKRINGKWEYDDQATGGEYDIRMGPVVNSQTIGWTPGCRCRGQRGRTVPCLVLDPFGGSGTTGKVALELGRRAALVAIAYTDAPPAIAEPVSSRATPAKPSSYRALAEARLAEVQLPLLVE